MPFSSVAISKLLSGIFLTKFPLYPCIMNNIYVCCAITSPIQIFLLGSPHLPPSIDYVYKLFLQIYNHHKKGSIYSLSSLTNSSSLNTLLPSNNRCFVRTDRRYLNTCIFYCNKVLCFFFYYDDDVFLFYSYNFICMFFNVTSKFSYR
jgi:hypothetical protein